MKFIDFSSYTSDPALISLIGPQHEANMLVHGNFMARLGRFSICFTKDRHHVDPYLVSFAPNANALAYTIQTLDVRL